jgi:predicted enzyme related to lactoylglutathione lyase
MSAVGTIGWIDLTVPDAKSLRDFYSAVTGWTPRFWSRHENRLENFLEYRRVALS